MVIYGRVSERCRAMSVTVRTWDRCPDCGNRGVGVGTVCGNCGRTLIVSQAEEYALAMQTVQQMQQPKRKSGVQGCASAIAGLMLLGIGLMLLIFVTPLGILFFGALIVIALVRVMLR